MLHLVPGLTASVVQLGPGQEVTVGISMRAPLVAGMCTAYFKITDAEGRLYFPSCQVSPLYCTVCVMD